MASGITLSAGVRQNLLALQNTASLTNTLADRDKVIGDTIDNLNVVLGTLADRDKELEKSRPQIEDATDAAAE